MLYDVIIIILILGGMLLGRMRGIIGAGLHAMSWLAAAAAGVFGVGKLAEPIGERFLYGWIYGALEDRFEGASEALDTSVNALPEFLRGGLVVDTSGTARYFTDLLTNLLVMVIVFLAILILVKVVLRILVTPIVARTRRRDSAIGAADRFLGMLLGGLEGCILVYVFLAVLMLLVNLGSPQLAAAIAGQLEDSWFAGILYDSNLLLFAVRTWVA